MVSPKIAARLADEFGSSTDEIMAALDDVADDDALRLIETSPAERLGHSGVKTFFDQPSRIASEGFSTGQQTLLGLGALGGGTYLGSEFLQNEEQRLENMEFENKQQALSEIMRAPHLSAQQKKDLIDRLMNQGFFDTRDRESQGGGILATLVGDLNLVETGIILIVVYFAGKSLVEYAARPSGGGN